MTGRSFGLSLLFGGLLAVTAGTVASAQSIGVAAAVVNSVTGVQGGVAAPLTLGDNVFSEQQIRTAAASTAQLLFLDQTTLTVGPEAEVTLDRFVFDPARGAGSVAIEATRGAFRFITGTQAPQNYTIQTPVATIGVLGTIAEWLVRDDGAALIVNSHGGVTATLPNGEVIQLPVGFGVWVHPSGKVEGPFPWPVMLDFFGGNLPLIRLAEIEDFDAFINLLDSLNEQHAQDPNSVVPPDDPCEIYCCEGPCNF